MFRRIIILTLVVISSCLPVSLAAASIQPPTVDAQAAILMVTGTKEVLFAKNPHKIMFPASTTKITTLITAIEKGNLNSIVTVDDESPNVEPSSLGINAGDKLRLRDLLYGMMLVSGNDAAEAVAIHIAGSVPKFVDMMNEKAAAIGCTNTSFSNPHGLPDPYNHYTTAYDLALTTDYALKNPLFAKIVATKTFNVPFLNRDPIYAENTNILLGRDRDITGVKTGYTRAAGECLVASAKRGHTQLIAVILKSEDRWTDARTLLDYGFAKLHI